MEQAITIWLDIAKPVFQAHGADAAGHVLFRKRLTRARLLGFLAATITGANAESKDPEPVPPDVSFPCRLAPGEDLARVQPITPRHRTDARPRHQRLLHNLLLVAPVPAPPAFDRDHFGSMHRPRSPPIATSRNKASLLPISKAASPSGYGGPVFLIAALTRCPPT